MKKTERAEEWRYDGSSRGGGGGGGGVVFENLKGCGGGGGGVTVDVEGEGVREWRKGAVNTSEESTPNGADSSRDTLLWCIFYSTYQSKCAKNATR